MGVKIKEALIHILKEEVLAVNSNLEGMLDPVVMLEQGNLKPNKFNKEAVKMVAHMKVTSSLLMVLGLPVVVEQVLAMVVADQVVLVETVSVGMALMDPGVHLNRLLMAPLS